MYDIKQLILEPKILKTYWEFFRRMWPICLKLPYFSFQVKKRGIQSVHFLKQEYKWQQISQNHGFSFTKISLTYDVELSVGTVSEIQQQPHRVIRLRGMPKCWSRQVSMKWGFSPPAGNCTAACKGKEQCNPWLGLADMHTQCHVSILKQIQIAPSTF